MPPIKYMQEIGLNCPDYWTNISNDGNKNYCRNSYWIDGQNPDQVPELTVQIIRVTMMKIIDKNHLRHLTVIL